MAATGHDNHPSLFRVTDGLPTGCPPSRRIKISSPLSHALAGLSIALIAAGSTAAPEPTDAPASTPARPPCTQQSAACIEAIAKLYIGALLSHDGSKLPLAPTIRRTENALTNARGDKEVRESFARTHMVERASEPRFVIDTAKGEVVVFFRIDVDVKSADAAGTTTRAGSSDYKVAVTVPEGTYTVHEAERFKIVKGYITEIEIIAHVEKGKGAGGGWPIEREAK
jgi:hypothetical protein